jgi:hypothetical protein
MNKMEKFYAIQVSLKWGMKTTFWKSYFLEILKSKDSSTIIIKESEEIFKHYL